MPANKRIFRGKWVMRDLRRYARQTNLRLGIGFSAILLIVGIGLVYIIFGAGAALMGLICLLTVFLPLSLIFAVLWLMDEFIRRNQED